MSGSRVELEDQGTRGFDDDAKAERVLLCTEYLGEGLS
jgi:hypothetical protein